MSFSVNTTKRVRIRRLRSGKVVTQVRWVVNYKTPARQRRQAFYATKAQAMAKAAQLLVDVTSGAYADDRQTITVAAAVRRWLDNRDGAVRRGTMTGYRQAGKLIVGPLLIGTQRQRADFTSSGDKAAGARLVPMLGDSQLKELTTADIRAWHRTVVNEVGAYSANRAKMFLKAALALAAEDFSIRPPAMPTTGRGQPKGKRTILTTDQVGALIEYTHTNLERGIYVAFPFLAGTRPSEQLGLLWSDIDFDANLLHIRRVQERDGTLFNFTKTPCGNSRGAIIQFVTLPVTRVEVNMP